MARGWTKAARRPSTWSPSAPTASTSTGRPRPGPCRASRPRTSGIATAVRGSGKPSPRRGKPPTAPSTRRPTGRSAIAAPVNWGRYLLEVESAGDDATSTSYEFYAGYYYPEAGSDTPDTLKVALDKPAYRVGDTAKLKLDPQFAGTALVLVIDDRIIDMKAVEVPAEGTSPIALPVTDDWGPGAYVTAMLYRPGSAAEKRMPARALGLAFADVDPGDRKLDVSLEAPRKPCRASRSRSRQDRQRPSRARRPMSRLPPSIWASSTSPDSRRLIRMAGSSASASSAWSSAISTAQLIDPTQGTDRCAVRSGGDGEGAVAARHAAAHHRARRPAFGHRRSRRRWHRDRQLRHAGFRRHRAADGHGLDGQRHRPRLRPMSSSAIRWSSPQPAAVPAGR